VLSRGESLPESGSLNSKGSGSVAFLFGRMLMKLYTVETAYIEHLKKISAAYLGKSGK